MTQVGCFDICQPFHIYRQVELEGYSGMRGLDLGRSFRCITDQLSGIPLAIVGTGTQGDESALSQKMNKDAVFTNCELGDAASK